MTKRLTIRFDERLAREIEDVAREKGVPVNHLINRIMRKYIMARKIRKK